MKKIITAALCVFMAAGCASKQEAQEDENQKLLRENEYRIHSLENSVSSLNTQIAQLNNRVYEVRTRSGQKTSMTVVPILPGSDTQPTQPVAQAPAAKAQTPHARRIDPTAKPTPMPAASPKPQAPKKPAANVATNVGATGSIGQPERMGGASGQLSGPSTDLALPPSDLPESVPVPKMNVATPAVPEPTQAGTPVPVPVMPSSDISLPPEHPDLPPLQQATQPVQLPAETAAPAVQRTPARTASQGEKAAYEAALSAARSGRAAEGVRLFNNFLAQYPNGQYAPNAHYWLGLCLDREGKYQEALSQFNTVTSQYPRHQKNADAAAAARKTMKKLGQ